MLENSFLSLSGHGYLHDVRSCQNGESFLTLNLIQEVNDSRSDDLWVECRFKMDKFPIAAKLDHYLDNEKSIILKFDAKYSGFQQCYSGMSDDDPRFIVHLHCELLNVYEYYTEGLSAFCPNIHGVTNNRILHSSRA